MMSELSDRFRGIQTKRVLAVGLVAMMLVLAGCSGGGGGGEGGAQTTVKTEAGGVDTTVMEVEEGGGEEEGATTVITESGGVETTVITQEAGTSMGTEMSANTTTMMG
jgi:ABC-type glycerol-3-phosphate transport system substrate-binding protein